MKSRRVAHGGVPSHVLTVAGGAGCVGRQLAHSENVCSVNVVGSVVSTVSVDRDLSV